MVRYIYATGHITTIITVMIVITSIMTVLITFNNKNDNHHLLNKS